MSQYSSLFHVVFNHGYFADKRCRHLKFVTTEATQTLLHNSGLSFRTQTDGFSLVADSQYAEALYMHAEDEQDVFELVFKVICTDPNFVNYSEPGVFKHDEMLFFQRPDTQSTNARLHSGDFVSDADFVSMAQLAKANMDIGGSIGGIGQQRPLCLVRLVVTKDDVYAFFDPNGAQAPVYTVDFVEPKTIWKYFLTGDGFDSNVTINDLDDKVQFDEGGVEVLPDGQEALTFKSKTALGLTERPPYRFVLRDKATSENGAGSKILIKRLPVASSTHRYQAVIDGKNTAISEIYINY
jgi:hypothetical protein